jgi:hypothetical protein
MVSIFDSSRCLVVCVGGRGADGVCVCVVMRLCHVMRVLMCVHVCVCVCVRERKRERERERNRQCVCVLMRIHVALLRAALL